MATAAATHTVERSVVEAFYQAYGARDFATIVQFLDDDVTWTISGPIDILPFCGTRRGKAAVMKLIDSDIPTILADRRFVPNAILVDGDRAAILSKLAATRRKGGRAISYRIAHFIRFHDQKVIEYISIIDSFDAVEQVLGHSLAVPEAQQTGQGDLIAV